MLIAYLPASIEDRDLRLRHIRISDGPFISKLLEHDDILKSSGVCKSRQSGGINTPRRTPWFLLYWWLRRTFLVAYCIERESRTIGLIGLSKPPMGEFAEISLVIFDPISRRRGFGTRAFQLSCRVFYTLAPGNILLVKVRDDNEAALSFWSKLGFDNPRSDGCMTVMSRRRLRETDR